MLTVLHPMGRTSWGSRLWMCRCDCGNQIIASTHMLSSNNLYNCGCAPKLYHRECIVCGKEFVTEKSAEVICSEACRKKRRSENARMMARCRWCSEPVSVRGTFCSEWCEQCYNEAHRKNKKIKPLRLTSNQELNYGENHKYSATVQVPEGLISYKERMKNG